MRIPPELAEAARARVGQPDLALSVLVRAGLAVLAGFAVKDALAAAQTQRGPKPRAEDAG
jgi:hypothetical protein